MGWRVFLLTAAAMTAFAANSLLCRLALRGGDIDPASFTSLRLVSGAVTLWLLLRVRGGDGSAALPRTGGLGSPPWTFRVAGREAESAAGDAYSAAALFVYAIAFSFAYVSLPVGVGALLLFGAVQASMLIVGLAGGERLGAAQGLGLAAAVAGLVYLVWPGLAAPAPLGTGLMLLAGIAWGVYSLRGRGIKDPVSATAGNFILAAPLALVANLLFLRAAHMAVPGLLCALASGALTSGLGYVIWYAALKDLGAVRAAIVQLSVPVIAAFGGVVFLAESVTSRLLLASCAILGGVAFAILGRQRRA